MINPSNPTVFRPISNLVTLGVLTFFILGINVSAWYTSRLKTIFELGAISAGLIIIGYLIFAKPKVIFFDEGLTIINPTERFSYSWNEIEELDTRFTLSFQVSDRKISVWAAPGATRRQAKSAFKYKNVGSKELQGLGLETGASLRPGDLPESDSGAAAAIARVRILEYSRTANPVKFPSEYASSYLALIVAGTLTLVGSVLLLIG